MPQGKHSPPGGAGIMLETSEPGELFVLHLDVRTVKTQWEVGKALPVSHPALGQWSSLHPHSSPGPLRCLSGAPPPVLRLVVGCRC